MLKSYITISGTASAEIVEKKSRFIGYVCNVTTEKEANEFINEIKSKNYDARHNVFAYMLLDNTKRYSDDSEPQGTAGIPILNIIEKQKLYNVCVVVTRYFGGILLGTGGLARAYSSAAKLALAESELVEMIKCNILKIQCNYTQYGKLPSIIMECGGIIDDTSFADDVTIEFHLPVDNTNKLSKEITEFSAGKLEFQIISEKFLKK